MLKKSAIAAIAGFSFIAACTDVNVPTNNPNQRTGEGAGIGALMGAAIGNSQGKTAEEKRKGVIVGGILGAAIGGAIGAQLDKQAAELRADLSDSRIQIINNGDHLIVRMPQDILFAVDSTVVSQTLRRDLGVLANNLNRYPGSTVQVVGHTDNTGTAAYNQDLSERRAGAVGAVLINRGVSARRIIAIGRGEDQPIASNLTPEGRAKNRRVEIVIWPTS